MQVQSDVDIALASYVEKARKLVDDARVARPPIEPARLAELRGIRHVFLSRSLEVSGQLIRVSGEFAIELNARESVERRNFSCCHEIAHTFAFDGAPTKQRVGPTGIPNCSRGSSEEWLCDRAAAEMLMPEKFFGPRALKMAPSLDSLVELAKGFACSLHATMLRLGELSVWPVVFIMWKFTAPPGSARKLRVWRSISPHGLRCFVPQAASADTTSGMYASYAASHPTCETEQLKLGSLRGRYLVENRRFGDHVISIVHDPRLRRRD